MAISEVIDFETGLGASPDLLVWKHPVENFNTTSQLIVPETHEALLVMNGNACDLFGPGKRTLETGNIPLLSKLINIPTGGKTPFPCKVFYINKVHQMDMLWGTQGAIPLEDPLYDIFMHVMLHGSICFSVEDSRRLVLKLVGFRSTFSPEDIVKKFRGIISTEVKTDISKIMIGGRLSYFMISANLQEIADVVKEKLSEVFYEYGLNVEYFNIETIEVPEKDYAEISAAKKARSSRLIQGYTWQEERQMLIMEKFASNQGSVGAIGGIMGGAVGGMVMGGSIKELARNALGGNAAEDRSVANVAGRAPAMGANAAGAAGGIDVTSFLKKPAQPAAPETPAAPAVPAAPAAAAGNTCPKCGSPVPANVKFCPSCGADLRQAQPQNVCPDCGTPYQPGTKFCPECGRKLIVSTNCPGCGTPYQPGTKFCPECGYKLI